MQPSPGASELTASASQGAFGNVQASAPGLALDRWAKSQRHRFCSLGLGHTFLQRLFSGTCLPSSRHALGTCRHHGGRSGGSELPWAREADMAEWDMGTRAESEQRAAGSLHINS